MKVRNLDDAERLVLDGTTYTADLPGIFDLPHNVALRLVRFPSWELVTEPDEGGDAKSAGEPQAAEEEAPGPAARASSDAAGAPQGSEAAPSAPGESEVQEPAVSSEEASEGGEEV